MFNGSIVQDVAGYGGNLKGGGRLIKSCQL